MPRRPNTKNLPSRLFEETATPVYVVDAELKLVYANIALANLLDLGRDEIVGCQLKYLADVDSPGEQCPVHVLCPPPRLARPIRNDSEVPVQKSDACFRVPLKDGVVFEAACNRLTFEEETDKDLLVCHLQPVDSNQPDSPNSDWLHERIQEFRRRQSSRFNGIPYLGDSPAARRCFSQARSYALLESNVSLIGHPHSQILDVAKSIHYSGFSNVEAPDPLLPVNCQQVEGERIQEILIGHCQVNQSDSGTATAHVLLLHADTLSELAQRDLLMLGNLDAIKLRVISTSRRSLVEVEGFDQELAFRLSTLEMAIPDLAERRTDIPFLAQNILEKLDRYPLSLSPELLNTFQVYPWTSDYQELESVLQSAVDNCRKDIIRLTDCPHDFRMAVKALGNPIPRPESLKLDELLSEIEKEAVLRAIKAANGNKTNAARMLDITRARLHRKLAEFASDLEGGDEADVDR